MRLPHLPLLLLPSLLPALHANPFVVYPASDVRMMLLQPQPSIIGADDVTRELNIGDTKDDTEWRSVIIFDLTGHGAAISKAKSITLQLTVLRTLGAPLADVQIVSIEPIDATRSFPSDGSSPALAAVGSIPASAKRGDRFEFDVSATVKAAAFDRCVGFRLQLIGGQLSKNGQADSLIIVSGSRAHDPSSGLTDEDRPHLVINP